MVNSIMALKAAGAKVIADDIGWVNSPIFNDGVVSQAAEQVTAAGVTYVSAAGNTGNEGWEAAWNGIPGQLVPSGGANSPECDL